MPRYKLTIEYDGTGLVGWQRQANGLSVQEALETAVERFCGETRHRARRRPHRCRRACAGAGRASRPAAQAPRPRSSAARSITICGPHAISVLAVEPVRRRFRRAALGDAAGVYLYRILNRRAPPALERGRVWHVGPPLDADGDAATARGS